MKYFTRKKRLLRRRRKSDNLFRHNELYFLYIQSIDKLYNSNLFAKLLLENLKLSRLKKHKRYFINIFGNIKNFNHFCKKAKQLNISHSEIISEIFKRLKSTLNKFPKQGRPNQIFYYIERSILWEYSNYVRLIVNKRQEIYKDKEDIIFPYEINNINTFEYWLKNQDKVRSRYVELFNLIPVSKGTFINYTKEVF